MRVQKFDDRESWLSARTGKITGSRLKDIIVRRGSELKLGFYQLIAERLALPADGENPMDRGNRLEDEAIERFSKETGKKVDTTLVLWSRDDNDNIAVSPDGVIGKKEAIEVKCLASALHLKAFLLQDKFEDFEEQVTQYFIVNESLETLYLLFYDPRLSVKDFFYFTFQRENLKDKISAYLEYEIKTLKSVQEIVTQLSF